MCKILDISQLKWILLNFSAHTFGNDKTKGKYLLNTKRKNYVNHSTISTCLSSNKKNEDFCYSYFMVYESLLQKQNIKINDGLQLVDYWKQGLKNILKQTGIWRAK